MPTPDLDRLTVVQRFILALVAESKSHQIRDHLNLQKKLFLLADVSTPLSRDCDFAPHHKGPYSEQVENSLLDLQDLGLLDFSDYKSDIRLTQTTASAVLQWASKSIPDQVREAVHRINDFFDGLSEDEILLIVYHDHPQIAVESVVRNRVEENRVSIAMSLYRKGKASLSRAAELGGLTLTQMKQHLAEKGYLRPGGERIRPTRSRPSRFTLQGKKGG